MKRSGLCAFTLMIILFITSKAYSETYSYYLPYFVGHTNHWTGIGLSNSSTTDSATINVFVYDTNGIILESAAFSIASRGHNVFTIGDGQANEGWIKINSTQPLVGLCFVATTGTPNYMADIPFASELSKLLYIPHIGQGPVYDTSVMVCNPNPSATTITLTYVDQEGNPLYATSQKVKANGSWKYDLQNLLNSTTANYGSLEISASKGLAAFALYNNLKKGGYSYAGISAVKPSIEPPSVPIETLAGTYLLNGFYVAFDDGASFSQNDLDSYSGTMTIASNGNSTQTVTVNGESYSVNGIITIIDNDTLELSSGGCSYFVSFSYRNGLLSIFTPSGVCDVVDFSETDIWEKTVSLSKVTQYQNQADGTNSHGVIGGAIGAFIKK